jgi:hypothetical protein
MICQCACAAIQRFGKAIDLIDNVHPFYLIWYHPLWKEALKSLHLYDYKDSPYYSFIQLEPTNISSAQDQDPLSNTKLRDTMGCFNPEFFDKIGHLGNISEAQHINKMTGMDGSVLWRTAADAGNGSGRRQMSADGGERRRRFDGE